MVAAKDAGLAGLRISPLRCHYPPAAQRGRFYLNLGDDGNHTPVESPGCATPDEEDKTDDGDEEDQNDDDDEEGTSYDNENDSRVHALFPLPEPPVVLHTERVLEQVYTKRVPTAIKSS